VELGDYLGCHGGGKETTEGHFFTPGLVEVDDFAYVDFTGCERADNISFALCALTDCADS